LLISCIAYFFIISVSAKGNFIRSCFNFW